MTEKLYENDSYLQTFTATVLACTPAPGGYAVVLDRTAFYPEGGGQPCDTGRLGDAAVRAVHTDGETVLHTTDVPLPVGGTVEGCIDWPARLDAMQQHTGEHILSGALHRLYGAENVGFHIGSPWVRMDTSIPLTAAQLAEAGGEVHHRPLVLELQGPEGHPLWDGTGQVTGLRADDQPLHHRLRPLLQGGVLRQAQIRGLRTNGVAAAGLLRQVVDQIAAGSLLVLGDEAAGGQKQQRGGKYRKI